jgi:hypothetical protein
MDNEKIEKQIHDFAVIMYQAGYEDGHKDIIEMDTAYVDAWYERGLNDAWECAKKIHLSVLDDGLNYVQLNEIFGSAMTDQIFTENSASDAIAKIKKYEEKSKRPKQTCLNCDNRENCCQGFTEVEIPCSDWKEREDKNIAHLKQELTLFCNDEGCNIDQLIEALNQMKGDKQ